MGCSFFLIDLFVQHLMSSAKNYVFTLNNYSELELNQLIALGTELPDPLVYLVFGKEKGESGTPHLQGYISLKGRKTLKFIKQIVGERSHVEIMRGTPQQASDYCKKEEDYQEFGVLPKGSGSRTDLIAVAEKVRNGSSFREIAEVHPEAAIRYGSGILRMSQLCRPKRSHPPQIKVFWGPTGTGKTRRVWEFADASELWVHPGGPWFDGYDQQKMVLLDDFDGSWFKLSFLLRILDRYVMPVAVKGGHVWWAPTTIFITSNLEPKDWYKAGSVEHVNALLRRLREFGVITHCVTEAGEDPMDQ